MFPDIPALVQLKLLVILHRGFVQARNLAYEGKHRECLVDLTDTFEVLPQWLMRKGAEALPDIRAALAEFQARHPEMVYDYLSILDMNEAEFAMKYSPMMKRWV